MNRRNVLFLLFSIVGIIADQASKQWIVANVPLQTGEIKIIPGFLSIVHAQNPGAAFGMLGDFAYRHWLFLAFTIVAGIVIVDMFRKLPTDDWLMSSALGLIMSGAVGNAIDRMRQQYVTDFIRVYTDHEGLAGWLRSTFGTNEWPSFNVADAALVVGVGLFIIHHLFFEEAEAGEAEPTDLVSGGEVPLDEDDIPTDKEPAVRPVPDAGAEAP